MVYHRENMILYNVLNQEVIFQEYFCNLIQFSEFKKVFINFVNSKLICNENVKFKNFNTEMILDEKQGRADLFLNFDNKKFIFEIKNKCYTNLTKNQPESYIEYLSNKNEHLFFMIPKQYNHIKEIHNRWYKKNSFENINKQILFWEDLIEELGKIELNTEIKMFYDFCLYWFNMKIVEFEEEEKMLFNKEDSMKNSYIPKMLRKLDMLIDNIAIDCKMKIDNDTIGYNYSKKVNDYIIYFGIDYTNWELKNEPITLLIQNHKNNYNDFNLEINGIELRKEHYPETKDTFEQYGYRVVFDDELGTNTFQENTKQLIKQVCYQLTNIKQIGK